MRKKIIILSILALGFSCTPYQRMFLSPISRNSLLRDSCDLLVINKLKLAFDTIGGNKTLYQSLPLKDLISPAECNYYTNRFYPPSDEDSAIWLLSIKPVPAGKDALIIGNLYTFDPDQDSTFIFQRRVKEYSQTEDFESGKYMVFTYYMVNDTATIVKAGKRKY